MLSWLMIVGCGGPEEIAFPPGLEPLPAENTAQWPANQAEAINTNSGEDGDIVWTHARGYVHADLSAVYPCLQEPEINLDRREVSEWSVIPLDDDAYDNTYILDILVKNIVDVEYEDTWRHGSTRDDDDQPVLTIAAWQMTENNNFMTMKRGSLVAEAVEGGISSLDIIYEYEVALPDEEQMQQYLNDIHTELIACVAGESLPRYD